MPNSIRPKLNKYGKPVKNPGLYKGEMRGGKRERPVTPEDQAPPPIDIPVTPEERGKLVPLMNPPPLPKREDGEDCHAPHPPPGYRYTMEGKLVPFVETRLSLAYPEAKAIFLEVLEITGSTRAACDALGIVSFKTIDTHLQQDPEFANGFDAARERFAMKLEAAAVQRAVHGYDVPIVGGAYKDEIVAYERRYSDTMLALLLKKHVPGFREAAATSTTKVTINNQQNNVEVDLSKMSRKERDAARLLLGDQIANAQTTDTVLDAPSDEGEDE
jgi:hypothetical protein